MPNIDYAMFVRIVAAVFSVSSVTAFTFAMLRLLSPHLFYLKAVTGTELILHYFVCGMVLITSVISFLNSSVVMFRSSSANSGRNITIWLLLDSLFESARVLHLFISQVLVNSTGPAQNYDLVLGGVQYLIDSLLYCQVILKKQ